MNEEEVLKVFKDLSLAQGFYGRLLADLVEAKNSPDEETREAYNNYMAQFKDCKTSLDVVYKVEC